MRETVKKDICPMCKKVRVIVAKKMFGFMPAWKCTKCGYAWTRKEE